MHDGINTGGARGGDGGRQTHQTHRTHQARQHNKQLLVAAARSGREDEARGVQSTHPFLRARHCRVCVCVGCHLLRTISPQGLQNAMTSAERRTSAEAENRRLPHREVTGRLLHPPWQSTSVLAQMIGCYRDLDWPTLCLCHRRLWLQ